MSTLERAMPMPKHVREGRTPSRSRSPSTTQRRRVPSPLRHAQFRPLAMEYAMSPQPSSCEYFNGVDDNEEVTLSEYCAHVRTVGYSTIGGKPFMSGKCPHCHRHVRSDKQVCTPNATPPPSPWRNALNNLQSPLRSPLRSHTSPKDGCSGETKTTISLRSPLRSPFKESFFGSNDDDDASCSKASSSHENSTAAAVGPAPAPAPAPAPRGVGLTRSPPREGGSGSPAPRTRSRSPSARARSPTPRANSPGPRSPVRGSSPSSGAFFGPNDDSDNSRSRSGSARSPRTERGRSPTPRGAEGNPFRTGGSPALPRSRSSVPVLSSTPPRTISPTRHTPPGGGMTRGPRSPGPRSPLRSPWKGASFFGTPQDSEEEDVEWSGFGSNSSIGVSSGGGGRHFAAKSRGAHSPGPNLPRSPLRVQVNFEEEEQAEEDEEKRVAAAAAAAAATASSKQAKGGWKSPLRSPFKGLFFGRIPKKAAGDVTTTGTE